MARTFRTGMLFTVIGSLFKEWQTMWHLIPISILCCMAIGLSEPTDAPSPLGIADEGSGVVPPKSEVAPPKDETPSPPRAHERVVNAINSEDWEGLREMAREGMIANRYIPSWEAVPIRVGELQSVQVRTDGEEEPYTIYTYPMEYADGRAHPHLIIINVREKDEDTESEILDIFELGW